MMFFIRIDGRLVGTVQGNPSKEVLIMYEIKYGKKPVIERVPQATENRLSIEKKLAALEFSVKTGDNYKDVERLAVLREKYARDYL